MLLGYTWLHSDGIFSHLHREMVDDEFYNLPSKQVTPPPASARYIAWVYDDSPTDSPPFPLASIYVPLHRGRTTLYKRFETSHLDILQVRKKQIDIASGLLRNWALNFPICLDPIVELRIVANREWIDKLLVNLTHLGKKRVVGYGEIRSLEVQRLPSAWDVLLDEYGALRRQIPLWAARGVDSTQVYWGTAHPPYWDKERQHLCVKPYEQVQLALHVVEQVNRYDELARA